MYDTSEDEIDKCFTDLEEKPLVHNSTPMKEGNYGGMVYDECMCKAGREPCSLPKEERHDYEKCLS